MHAGAYRRVKEKKYSDGDEAKYCYKSHETEHFLSVLVIISTCMPTM